MCTRLYFFVLTICLSCQSKDQEAAQNFTQRPNILFVMADDHAVQAISAYGHPISRLAPTPNIDRIAQKGAVFNNAFCTNSICGPSRAVILTGKHSHINGFRMNGEVFDGDQPTVPKYLQQLGYETAIVGKWHLHGYPQGFNYWKIIDDQGNYYNPDFLVQPADSSHHPANKKKPETNRIEGYATDIVTELSLEWLSTMRPKDKPFFLMVHHKAPHRNWMPALRHANKYDEVEFPLPDTYFAHHDGQRAAQEQQQTIYRDMYEGHDLKMTVREGSTELAHNPWTSDFDRMTTEQRSAWDSAYQTKNDAFHKANLTGKDLAVWKAQRYLQDYLATIAAVDEGVGKILDYLEENNLDKNTLVVYTSDQGFYLGEHGWFDKRFMYEESLRTPVLIQFPGVVEEGISIDALVQNLDFAQTFLDFAGGEEYTVDMQGQSLRPLLEYDAEDEEFRDYVYYHYYDYPAFHMVKKHYGIRGKRYKLIHFYDDIDSWEFYDLAKDPNELNNLIDAPGYQDTIAVLKVKLRELQDEYQVTEKEFQRAPKKDVEKAYKMFDKLRGEPWL